MTGNFTSRTNTSPDSQYLPAMVTISSFLLFALLIRLIVFFVYPDEDREVETLITIPERLSISSVLVLFSQRLLAQMENLQHEPILSRVTFKTSYRSFQLPILWICNALMQVEVLRIPIPAH